MSAMHAAAPALAIFTPRGGGTSEGLSPTMFYNTGGKYSKCTQGLFTKPSVTQFLHRPASSDIAVDSHISQEGSD